MNRFLVSYSWLNPDNGASGYGNIKWLTEEELPHYEEMKRVAIKLFAEERGFEPSIVILSISRINELP